ncbi:MAG: hypothetical protein EOP09_08460, partial [Proteobacteria bacterium]
MNEQDIPQQPEIPAASASEAAYLGALLAGKVDAIYLDPAEFLINKHVWIYEKAVARLMSEEPYDVSLVVEDLTLANLLVEVGGPDTFNALIQQGQHLSAEVIEEHGRIIRQRATARKLKALAAELATDVMDDPLKVIKSLISKSEDLQDRLSVSRIAKLTNAGELRAKFGDQEWLWSGYIPIGHVTCLIAQQGQGKSNVALDFCHRLAIGAPFPDGQEPGIRFDENDRILYLDSEGFLQGILSRMEAWGTPDGQFLWPEGCDEKRWELNTTRGWAEFESLVAQFRPRLVVIDSLSGANSLEEKDNDQMKTVLQN